VPSPWRDHIKLLDQAIEAAFINEFNLLTPFAYDEVQAGERYGYIYASEQGGDPALQARDIFQIVPYDILLVIGSDSEQAAKGEAAATRFDIDHFLGSIKGLIEHYSLVYDFRLQGSISNTLSQPINNPEVWLTRASATINARIAIPKLATGAHREP
jgi:hypothetical protein